MSSDIERSPEIAAALRDGGAVVALESTVIAHGLPWPANLQTARAAEQAVREEGAVPATVAVWRGRPTVGLDPDRIEHLARSGTSLKASRRDLAAAMAQEATAATTVAATMALAHSAGVRVLATGGIGGVHRHATGAPSDVSADLLELARTPVAVVCAGAKSVLDLPATLELLESLGVPVVGYRTHDFPAFYVTSSGLPVSARVETPAEAARMLRAHWGLGGAGLLLCQPLLPDKAVERAQFGEALARAEAEAARQQIRGPALTPFLLARLAEFSGGLTVRANEALIVANARLAARLAVALAEGDKHAGLSHR